MADEPGRPGQSTGADAGTRTTGAGTASALPPAGQNAPGTTTGTAANNC
jgi:hypothetical protein